MDKIDLEKVIILLCIVVVFLIGYSIFNQGENFEQVDICDYDSPDPSMFCKSIKKGCTDLIYEFKDLNNRIKDNCTELPNSTKDIIDVAINCSNDTDKLIMNNYVQNEVCSQIKNFPGVNSPGTIPLPNVLAPISYTGINENNNENNNEIYMLNSPSYANF
jgi:hypothetical protein